MRNTSKLQTYIINHFKLLRTPKILVEFSINWKQINNYFQRSVNQ